MCLLAVEAAGAATLRRGPYLQLLTTSSVTIVWNTDVSAGCSLAIRPLGGVTSILTAPTGTVCAIPVTGLAPGAMYGYVPLADGLPLGDESVFQADDPSLPFSFLVVGDSGCGCMDQLNVADRMRATPHDFIIHTGDMIYDTGLAEDFNPKFFAPYRQLINRVVFWPTIGNHDFATANAQPWRDAFYTPANNPAGNEGYYSFDFGNAHVAVIDSDVSTSPGSAQYVFLDQDLAASTALWKFVAFHHSIYATGRPQAAIQANLVPLFDRQRVDVVFMGHQHVYERTYPLLANQIVPPGQGTVYITTGGGGESEGTAGVSSFTAYSEGVFHFTRVVVNGGTLLAQMIRDDGLVRDAVTLVKGTPPPPARCGDGIVNQASEQCDGDDHPACTGACAANCTCAPACGDGRTTPPAEACDGADDAACPGLCLSSCRCGTPGDFVTLAPLADTYVENGTQATWDHGIADRLLLDTSPFDVMYLKFDLGAPAAAIARATLSLHCTNGSPDGGTFYPVASSGWTEGTRNGADTGSADGPGLKWNDVDTNADGILDSRDGSPFEPDFTRPLSGLGTVVAGNRYSGDVTAAFAGPGVHTVAVVNLSGSTDGAIFSSRENSAVAQRPQLRVELARAPACGSDAECDDGLRCNGAEVCIAGGCRPGIPMACSDGFTCTNDGCDETLGCVHTPRVCNDVVACTSDRCDETAGGCVYERDDTACDDGDLCTTDVCDGTIGCRHTESGLCPPALVDVAPLADTYIEAGTEATWDHGLSDHLDVDLSPVGIAYLKFDLQGVSARVSRATLNLFCTNSSVDGGTVYPVGDPSWPEGDRNGGSTASANGPGLKWNDVDTNRDGTVDTRDTSPYVPDFSRAIVAFGQVTTGQRYTVDVTSAFQNGPGLYTLALRNQSSDGSTFSSMQHPTASQRPVLHLELVIPPLTTTTTVTTTTTFTAVTTTTSTTSTSTTAAVTTTTTTTPPTPTTSTTQPPPTTTTATTTTATTSTTTTTPSTTTSTTIVDLAPVADTYIESGSEASWDHGISGHLDVDLSPIDFTYLRFDLRGVTGQVTAATLTLFCTNTTPDGGTVYRVANSGWTEGNQSGSSNNSANGPGLKWNDVDTNRDGKVDTQDTSPFVPDFAQSFGSFASVKSGQAKTIDVRAAFQSGPGLYTIAIKSNNSNGGTYASRESSTVSRRPRLRVTWR